MRVRSHLEGETTRESRAMVSASQEQITAIASVSWQRRVADATAFLLCRSPSFPFYECGKCFQCAQYDYKSLIYLHRCRCD